MCDEQEDKQSCIENIICQGRDPSTGELTPIGDDLAVGSPMVGTNGNWEVSPEMAQACGGIPGRFGSRPDPDPGSSLKYPDEYPGGAALFEFQTSG